MTSKAESDLVVDTGPLSHLAEAHAKPHLQQVLDSGWIVTRSLSTDAELAAFAHFAGRLVVGSRNVGEARYSPTHRFTAP